MTITNWDQYLENESIKTLEKLQGYLEGIVKMDMDVEIDRTRLYFVSKELEYRHLEIYKGNELAKERRKI